MCKQSLDLSGKTVMGNASAAAPKTYIRKRKATRETNEESLEMY